MRGSFGRNLESMLMCGSAIICMAPASHAAAQSGVMHQFDIPAQDAARALEAFGKQSGDTILFDQRRMSAKRSADVKGRFSSEGALRRLLAPTGIVARKVGERTYVIAASAVSIPARLTVDPAQGSAAEPQSAEQQYDAAPASPAVADTPDVPSTPDIIVTGSRVIRDGSKAPTPVSVVTRDEIEAAAPVTIADYVNQLPALSGSTSPRTAGGGIGGGTAGANLLNLRNLGANRTLILVNGRRVTPSTVTGVVDINTIPTALVKRVDVVTGGASASYGSDAVSGVVNFILDTKYQGFKAEVQSGVSDRGDVGNYSAQLAFGRSFADDRVHFVASADFSKSGDAYLDNRSWYRAYRTFANPAYAPGNGQPARLILPNSSLNTTDNGLINTGPLRGYAFDANGQVATTSFPFGDIESGFFQHGGTQNDDNALGHVVQPAAPTKQGAIYARASFDIADWITAFGELSYGDSHVENQSGLFWRVNQATVRRDNAFLPASVVQAMTNAGVTSFSLSHNNRAIGIATGVNDRSVFRALGGLEGKVGDNWTWGLSFQYGLTKITNAVRNNPMPGRYALAIDAVVNPANGQIICRSTLTNPNNGCVPYNPLGSRPLTDAQRAYLIGYARQDLRIRQDVIEGSAQGDLFDLPAGTVSLAFGGAYRRESARGDADALSLVNSYYVGNYKPFRGRYNVKEGFAELLVPLLKDSVLGQSLSLNTAIRYTDYSTSGSVKTWKVGAVYTPIDDITIRLTRSRDIRAPNLSDLFLGGVVNTQQVNNPFRNNLNDQYLQTTSGNPNLKPEVANTLTAGLVLKPSFLPGLTLSADFYDIKIRKAISSTSGQLIINNCFAGDASYCALIGGDPRVDVTAIQVVPFNAAQARARGVDFELNYQTSLGAGMLSLRGLLNYTDELSNMAGNSVVSRAGEVGNNDGGGQGVPYFRGLASATYKVDPMTLQLKGRFLSASKLNREYTSADINLDYNNIPAIFYLDAYMAFDANVAGRSAQFFMAIDNVLDKDPPVVVNNDVANAQNSGTSNIYDIIGRQYRVGFRVKF